MKLADDTLKLIDEIKADTDALSDKYVALANLIMRDTNDVLTCCNNITCMPFNIHLYDETVTGRGIDLIKETVAPSVRWEDDNNTCYAFEYDNKPFIILVGKEK